MGKATGSLSVSTGIMIIISSISTVSPTEDIHIYIDKGNKEMKCKQAVTEALSSSG